MRTGKIRAAEDDKKTQEFRCPNARRQSSSAIIVFQPSRGWKTHTTVNHQVMVEEVNTDLCAKNDRIALLITLCGGRLWQHRTKMQPCLENRLKMVSCLNGIAIFDMPRDLFDSSSTQNCDSWEEVGNGGKFANARYSKWPIK